MDAGHIDGLVRAATENRRTYGFTDVPATPEAMARYVATAIAERERGLAVPFVLRERSTGPGGADSGSTNSANTDSGSAGRIVGATRFLDLGFWRPTASPTGSGPSDAAGHRTTFHWSAASGSGTAVHSSTTTTTTATTITVVMGTPTAATPTAATPPREASTASDSPEAPPSVAEIGSTWLAASAQRTAVNTETKLLLLGHAFDTWATLRVCLKTDARNARSRAAIERLGARFEGVRRAHVLAFDGTARDSAYYSIVRAEWPAVRAGLVARLARP
ncbi:GNAT family N-acetyltransferase [Frankia sp. AiPs1]|uniref:GNAT family N-acetyltransferase n=1 Tax=Frankia sp. AiPs1 TaxID=573493 RepID=UPI002043A39C|nr:GNAT family protein [Frankia sp. AiPs1]MCM3923073.1 GNAT family N-acetyltransferase [Frankia sp. AiPs1]